jgi:hypothetical protein
MILNIFSFFQHKLVKTINLYFISKFNNFIWKKIWSFILIHNNWTILKYKFIDFLLIQRKSWCYSSLWFFMWTNLFLYFFAGSRNDFYFVYDCYVSNESISFFYKVLLANINKILSLDSWNFCAILKFRSKNNCFKYDHFIQMSMKI